jgi:hypothetical protein
VSDEFTQRELQFLTSLQDVVDFIISIHLTFVVSWGISWWLKKAIISLLQIVTPPRRKCVWRSRRAWGKVMEGQMWVQQVTGDSTFLESTVWLI